MDENSPPRVSIGMPVYNGAKWIAATIDSVLDQDFADFELVISDNASTDATEQICREYQQRDPRVRYFRNPVNVGVSNNFNKAFERARGTYFKWTSCSDFIEPQFVSKCLAVLEARPEVVLVFPRTRLFKGTPENGHVYDEVLELDLEDPVQRFIQYTSRVRLNNIMHGLIRSDALRRTGMYRKFLAADYNMIAELLLYGRAVLIPDVLHLRRMENETLTITLSASELRRLYEPARPSRMSFQVWRAAADYFRIALGAPLPLRARMRLLYYVIRRTLWWRVVLWNDLRGSLALALSRSTKKEN